MNEAALLQHPVLRCLRRALPELSLQDGPLLLAVSGGRDSTAMAGAMALLQRRDGVGLLRIAHVHHHQREASDQEAALVERLGDRLSLPVEVLHLELPKGSTPAMLRDARYAALTKAANTCRADAVLTAHHAEDQLETMLLAMVRGCGPRGLAGMEALRPLDDGLLLARPLLQTSRHELHDLCLQMDLPFCDDPCNEDPSTHRGRLRRDVLPVLEAMRPGVAVRAAAMAPVQAACAGAFAALLPQPDEGTWPREQLARLPHAIVLAALHAAAAQLVQVDALSAATLSEAAAAIGDAREHERLFEVGGGVSVVVDAKRVTISC
jgi:tRNA(Ile)-lysidine synthase